MLAQTADTNEKCQKKHSTLLFPRFASVSNSLAPAGMCKIGDMIVRLWETGGTASNMTVWMAAYSLTNCGIFRPCCCMKGRYRWCRSASSSPAGCSVSDVACWWVACGSSGCNTRQYSSQKPWGYWASLAVLYSLLPSNPQGAWEWDPSQRTLSDWKPVSLVSRDVFFLRIPPNMHECVDKETIIVQRRNDWQLPQPASCRIFNGEDVSQRNQCEGKTKGPFIQSICHMHLLCISFSVPWESHRICGISQWRGPPSILQLYLTCPAARSAR